MSSLEILFEDNHILAVVKPAGIPTQVSPHTQKALEKIAKDWLKKRDQKPGNVFLHAIYRLDSPVKGIVLFAKSQKALTRLTLAQKQGRFTKEYQAIVEGHYTLKNFPKLYLKKHAFYAEAAKEMFEGAKEVFMEVSLLEFLDGRSLLKILLLTGRYHQIRACLAFLGYPIIGDEKYGASTPFAKGIALTHTKLCFPHPVSKENIELMIPL